jgi:multidrug efflux system membrane fusion protein
MRILTATVASLVALGAATVAGVEISNHVMGEAKASAPGAAMMAMPVPVAAVVKQTLPIYLDFPGRTEAIRSIALQARASGYVESQPAPDGADVKSGDLLYKIDPRDLQAALDQAQAQVRRDTASLEYAKANFSPRRGVGEEAASSPRTCSTSARAR